LFSASRLSFFKKLSSCTKLLTFPTIKLYILFAKERSSSVFDASFEIIWVQFPICSFDIPIMLWFSIRLRIATPVLILSCFFDEFNSMPSKVIKANLIEIKGVSYLWRILNFGVINKKNSLVLNLIFTKTNYLSKITPVLTKRRFHRASQNLPLYISYQWAWLTIKDFRIKIMISFFLNKSFPFQKNQKAQKLT